MAEWQPIETAPKDGRGILLYVPDDDQADESNIWLAYWEDDKWKGYPDSDLEPTHWMSLPAPPNIRVRD